MIQRLKIYVEYVDGTIAVIGGIPINRDISTWRLIITVADLRKEPPGSAGPAASDVLKRFSSKKIFIFGNNNILLFMGCLRV